MAKHIVKLRPEPPEVVLGKFDPTHKGCTLVDPRTVRNEPYFPKLRPDRNLPRTYFRWDKKERRVRCMVTIMPKGVHVAWDVCGYCAAYFTLCRCADGLSTCRSVEYIYDAQRADLKGEVFDYNHPDYFGSLTRGLREKLQDARSAPIFPARSIHPPEPSQARRAAPAAGKKHVKFDAVSEAGGGRLKKMDSLVQSRTKKLIKRLEDRVDEYVPKKPIIRKPPKKRITKLR